MLPPKYSLRRHNGRVGGLILYKIEAEKLGLWVSTDVFRLKRSGDYDNIVTSAFDSAPIPEVYSCAGVVKLADTHGSGPCALTGVGVQVPSPAPF